MGFLSVEAEMILTFIAALFAIGLFGVIHYFVTERILLRYYDWKWSRLKAGRLVRHNKQVMQALRP